MHTAPWLSLALAVGACAEPASQPGPTQDVARLERPTAAERGLARGAVQVAATPSLRVMPLGDSITAGVGSSTGSSYRAALWDRLAGQRLDFVGTQQSGQLPDLDNEGHSGWVIDQIAGIVDASLAFYRPNIVTLHIGTNDLNNNTQVATAPARLGALIDRILVAAPDATVLVATLVPSTTAVTQTRIVEYNRQIPGLVAQRRNAGKHVMVVDMAAVTTADLADALHPNDNGYRKMADAFYAGILRALAAGWIAEPVPGGPGRCADVPGGWADHGQIAAGTGAGTSGRVRFADINGDGRADYLVVADNGALHAWINNGGDTAAGPGWIDRGQIAAGTGAPPSQLRFADIDGDGRDDYLVIDPQGGAVHAWLNRGGDTSTGPGWVDGGQIAGGTGAPLAQIELVDITGDRRADYLVVADNGAIHAWINDGGDGPGGHGWIDRGQIAAGTGAPSSQLRFADITCDGRADYLVVAGATGAIHAWVNNGGDTPSGPGWIDRGQIASGAGPGNQIRFADMNGDGRADYLVVADNGAIHAWINNGGDAALVASP